MIPCFFLGRRSARRFVAVLLVLGGAVVAQGASWLKVSTPDITVVTPLPARQAIPWATEFAQFVAALRSLLGPGRAPLPALTVVLFANSREFQSYLPLSGPKGRPLPVDGFFSRHEAWAVAGVTARISDDTRRTIFHEGVHWFLSVSGTRNPLWLEEGLAEVYSTFRTDRGQAEWGQPIESHLQLLRQVAPLPLERLLDTSQPDLFGHSRLRGGIFYAESWAFVHFLLFGTHDIPRDALGRYLEQLSAGTPPAEAFQIAFGRSFAEMDQLLSEYRRSGEHGVTRLPLAAVDPPKVGPASAVEVGNGLGRLAIAGHRTAQAMAHAGAVLAAAPGDPRGHELLAMALQASGDPSGALIEFEAAVTAGSKDFQPYFEVAVAAHGAAMRERRALAPSEARFIANRYERALENYPRFQKAYENLAAVLAVADPWSEADRKYLEQGRRMFPDAPIILVGLAQFQRRMGDRAGARRTLDQVLTAQPEMSPDGVQFAQQVDVAWQQEDVAKRVDELGRAGKFAEAIELLDAKLASFKPDVRQRLSPLRDRLQVALLSQQVKEARDERRWTDARRALVAITESSAPAAMKEQARRALTELDRDQLQGNGIFRGRVGEAFRGGADEKPRPPFSPP